MPRLDYFPSYGDEFVPECDCGCGWAKSWIDTGSSISRWILTSLLSLIPRATCVHYVREHLSNGCFCSHWFLCLEFPSLHVWHPNLIGSFRPRSNVSSYSLLWPLIELLKIFLLRHILHCIVLTHTHARLWAVLYQELTCMRLSSRKKTSPGKFLPCENDGWTGRLDNVQLLVWGAARSPIGWRWGCGSAEEGPGRSDAWTQMGCVGVPTQLTRRKRGQSKRITISLSVTKVWAPCRQQLFQSWKSQRTFMLDVEDRFKKCV